MIIPHLTLPCLALSYLASSYLIFPYLTIPCLTLVYIHIPIKHPRLVHENTQSVSGAPDRFPGLSGSTYLKYGRCVEELGKWGGGQR